MTDHTPGPSDIAVFLKLHAIYQTDPKLGVEKVHKRLLAENPEWTGKVSLKRVKTIRNNNGLVSLASGAPGTALLPGGLDLLSDAPAGLFTSTAYPRKRKTDTELQALESCVAHRLATASPALHAQNAMHAAAKEAGEQFGGGWYAVLPDGEEEYVWGRVLWVHCAVGEIEEAHGRYAFIERGKTEGVLGNPAGVYMVYMGVRSAVAELEIVRRGEITASDERIARQLEAEYGLNPIPFGEEVKRDPEGPCSALLTNILWDLAIG